MTKEVIEGDFPIIDMNGTNDCLSVLNYKGSIKLINKTDHEPVKVTLQSGTLVVAISGEIVIEREERV